MGRTKKDVCWVHSLLDASHTYIGLQGKQQSKVEKRKLCGIGSLKVTEDQSPKTFSTIRA